EEHGCSTYCLLYQVAELGGFALELSQQLELLARIGDGAADQLRGKHSDALEERIQVGAFLDGHFVLDPVGEGNVTEENPLLHDEGFAAGEQQALLADEVALFGTQVGEKLVEGAALDGLFPESMQLVEGGLLGLDGGAGGA